MDIEHLRRAAEQLIFFQSFKNLPQKKSWTFLLWLGYFLSELYRLNPKWPIFWKIWPLKWCRSTFKKKEVSWAKIQYLQAHLPKSSPLGRDLRMAPVPQYVAKVPGVSSRSVVAGWISLEWKIAPRWSLVCLVKLTPEKPWKAAIYLLCMPFYTGASRIAQIGQFGGGWNLVSHVHMQYKKLVILVQYRSWCRLTNENFYGEIYLC